MREGGTHDQLCDLMARNFTFVPVLAPGGQFCALNDMVVSKQLQM